MEGILPGYEVSSTTWCYLSCLLIVAVFFRFNRIWSLRNLDLLLCGSLTPGVLAIWYAQLEGAKNPEYWEFFGYAWLLTVTAILLARTMFDGFLTRRPHLEPNLNQPGLVFLCFAAFVFLSTTAFQRPAPESTLRTIEQADELIGRNDGAADGDTESMADVDSVSDPDNDSDVATKDAAANVGSSVLLTVAVSLSPSVEIAARVAAVLSHFAVIAGLWYMGWRQFGDAHLGIAMATLYLLLPVTSIHVGEVNHVLPTALIVWALATLQRPVLSGGLLGLACGTQLFPVFLLPLWMTAHDRRGALRFGGSFLAAIGVVVAAILLSSNGSDQVADRFFRGLDWARIFTIDRYGDGQGFWKLKHAAYRIPAFAGFVVTLVAVTIWPLRKNREQMLARTATVLLATQFWYPQSGGLYVLWYLPLVLLVAFRPRLERRLGNESAERHGYARRNGNAGQNGDRSGTAVTGSSRYVFR